jgi:hypothetical protein
MKRVKDASESFKLIVEMFPWASTPTTALSNVENGDKTLAVQNYKKSLELNPKNGGLWIP